MHEFLVDLLFIMKAHNADIEVTEGQRVSISVKGKQAEGILPFDVRKGNLRKELAEFLNELP